ncbi:MAG: diaminopimelate decarboxylase [Desulfobacterales bacterium SG8_35_2]|jgi:diaminopimelate decarboxylase|nr:MAG: diaminopimelate decarboxylase [Desulfobacterales bacterium SG8_35_2]
MHHFIYKDNELYCESVAIADIAKAVGTPFYLYSSATLTHHFNTFDKSFGELPHMTCFAVKACSNLAILRLFSTLGGGADIVSGGELYRSLKAGIDPRRIIFSGVGKTEEELRYGLVSGILMFNVESEQELEKLQQVAKEQDLVAPVSFRINPDVDPKTHAYISTGLAKNKFGIPIEQAEKTYLRARDMSHIKILGVSCHIGSQLTEISPFTETLHKVKLFINRLEKHGIAIDYLDLGGGLGVRYQDEKPPHPQEYARALKKEMAGLECTLILEPGRVIVSNAGILISQVLYTKQTETKNFIIVDAAMNDLARPSLYGAHHDILPVVRKAEKTGAESLQIADVVGPICETGDFLARDRQLPAFEQGNLLAIMTSGAYGFTMSSNYNSRPRAAEVLVKDDQFYIIRARENYETLIRDESIPEFLE